MSSHSTFFLYIRPQSFPGVNLPNTLSIKFRVIEVDGVALTGNESFEVVQVDPGQRMSVLVDPDGLFKSVNGRIPVELSIVMDPSHYRKSQASVYNDCVNNPSGQYCSCTRTGWNPTGKILRSTAVIYLGKPAADVPNPYGRSPAVLPSNKASNNPGSADFVCFPWLPGQSECTANANIWAIFTDYDDLLLTPLNAKGRGTPPTTNKLFMVQTNGVARSIDPDPGVPSTLDNNSTHPTKGFGDLRIRSNPSSLTPFPSDFFDERTYPYHLYSPAQDTILKRIANDDSTLGQCTQTSLVMGICENIFTVNPDATKSCASRKFWIALHSSLGAHPCE
jgi:hypothetical protein